MLYQSLPTFLSLRLYTISSGFLEPIFKNPKNAIYHRAFKNNMDENSFLDFENGLRKVTTTPQSAFLSSKMPIYHSEVYQNCRIEFTPWEQNIGSLSFPITKSSPYEPFMKQIVTDLYSTGVLKKLQQKWLEAERQCEKPDVKPISPQKVITSFIWIFIGMTTSVMTFIVERLFFKCKKAKEVSHQSNAKDVMKTRIKNMVDDLFQQEDVSDEDMVYMIVSAANAKIMKETSV